MAACRDSDILSAYRCVTGLSAALGSSSAADRYTGPEFIWSIHEGGSVIVVHQDGHIFFCWGSVLSALVDDISPGYSIDWTLRYFSGIVNGTCVSWVRSRCSTSTPLPLPQPALLLSYASLKSAVFHIQSSQLAAPFSRAFRKTSWEWRKGTSLGAELNRFHQRVSELDCVQWEWWLNLPVRVARLVSPWR